MWLKSEIISLGLVYFSGLMFHGRTGPPKAESRGFGDEISWKVFDEALYEAQHHRKPVMMIIHKSWCPACRALKPVVAASQEISDLSKNFVMVNVVDEEEPQDKKFAPDGAYIPRILFLDRNGDVMTQFYNELGNPSYKFFYFDSSSIVRTMRKVVSTLQNAPDQHPPSFIQRVSQSNDGYVSDIYEDEYSHSEL